MRVGRLFTIRVIGLGIASLIQASWLVLLARVAGVDAVGVYAIFTAWFMFASSVLGFGMGAYALRLGARSDETDAVVTTMTLLRLAAVATIALGCVICAVWMQVSPTYMVAVAILYGALESVTELSQGVFSGRRRVTLAVVLLVAQRSLPVAGLLVDIAIGSIFLVFVGLGLAFVLAAWSLLSVASRPHPMAKLIRASGGYWGSTVVSNVSQLDTPVVGITSGLATASLFGTASRLTSPLNLITTALLNVLVPELVAANSHRTRKVLFRRVRNVALAVALCLFALAYPLGLLVAALLGPDFHAVTPYVVGFVVAGALSGISRTYQAGLFATDRAKQVALAILVGALTGLILILILGTALGPTGVALAPPLAQVVILIWLAIAWRITLRDAWVTA